MTALSIGLCVDTAMYLTEVFKLLLGSSQ